MLSVRCYFGYVLLTLIAEQSLSESLSFPLLTESSTPCASVLSPRCRVLYLAMSPDGQSIVTGAGDETLRFWNVFPGPRAKAGFHVGPSALTPSGSDIR